MYWLEVSVITDGEGAEAVAETLRPFAYQEGVVLEQLGDMTSADLDALDTAVTVKIYLPEAQDSPQMRRRIEKAIYFLGRLYPIHPPTYKKLEEEDWAHAWKAHYHPFRIGEKIWVQPSWLEDELAAPDINLKPDDVVLTLDPGMAFGTGLHPTTQMCLQALEAIIIPGNIVLDVGTGSGILGIAAAKLGAKQVLGIDVDKIAVQTAVSNAKMNHVMNFEVSQGTLNAFPIQKGQVVLVNILAPVIIDLLKTGNLMEYVAAEGHLILSGIIDEQADGVKRAVIEAGGQILNRLTIRDWVTFIVVKK